MEQLIKTAQDNDILIVDMRMKGKQGAMSQCTDGMCIIAIDPHKVKSIADRKEKTVHELGHCMTQAVPSSPAADANAVLQRGL